MATLDAQRYSTQYTGLITTAGLALGVMGVMLTAFETFGRLPRNTARRKRPGFEDQPDSVENYVMAYLYRPRAFLGRNRGPQIPRWPLLWIWQVIRLPQDWYLKNTGLDSAVYVRFITGCWMFMLSQVLTTLLILLPLYISYAPDNILPSSIAQASVSSLVNSVTGGREYLWVRTVLLWWQSFCWICVVVYVGWGNIRMRREQILDPLQDAKDADKDEEQSRGPQEGIPPGVSTKGWRFRTVKVSNVPQHMRNEQSLRAYFDACLAFLKQNPNARFYHPALPATGSPVLPQGVDEGTAVDHVVIVRKLSELHELFKKRTEVMHLLESAHVELARSVMDAVAARLMSGHDQSLAAKVAKHFPQKKKPENLEDIDALVEQLGGHLKVDSPEAKRWKELFPAAASAEKTIWETLSEVPAELLDPYQPVVKLKFFRGQVAPSIDYHLTKLNLLTSLIDDLRSRPDSYAACDTAFVTFTRASDARLVKKELSWIRARGLTCRVRMAPDTRDLDWDKLVEANFRGDVFRGFITHTLVWIATLIWILPMGALVGLVSIDNLSTRIPALARWLNDNPRAKSLGSTLIPTIIVALVNMLVPTIVIQVSGRGQTFVTLSKLHHATWCRYWKWVVINVIIAFCAGTALFTSILGIFTGSSFSETENNPLNVIASSFPNGAIFFVSYSILVIGTQCFFELGQFLIPWILYNGIRKATSPRQRFTKTEGRRFFSYTLGPNHTLIISIMLTFSLLNPLPLAFGFLYFSFAVAIFKDHFARLYWRVYYEQNGRLFYMRIMRYSLDALVLGQVVNMALFFVLKDGKNGGACAALIPITIIIKLVLTRWYDAHMDAADAMFADIVCQQGPEPSKEGLDARENHAGHKARRKAINEKLRDLQMPELSLGATLKIPFTGRSTLRAQRGPQAILHGFTRRLQNKGSYAELQEGVARREANLAAASDLAAPSAEKTLHSLENPDNSKTAAAPVIEGAAQAVATPHPKLQRDDRPDFSAPYIDPFLAQSLDNSLWLPRDPLYVIDLDDTIDWHGRALVSSEGGNGTIGAWNPGSEDDSEAEQDEAVVADGDEEETLIHTPADASEVQQPLPKTPSRLSGRTSLRSARSPSPRKKQRLVGSEKIRVASDIASRYVAETGAPNNDPLRPSLSRLSNYSSSSSRRVMSPSPIASPNFGLGVPPSSPDLPRFQRSASVAQGQTVPPSSPAPAAEPAAELRRVRSEILDPSEKRQVRRRPTLVLTPAPEELESGRGRSESNATRGSKTPLVSQSRALAHEVIQEEREQAVERRKQEDKRMLSKISNSRSRIRNLFYKAPDDAD